MFKKTSSILIFVVAFLYLFTLLSQAETNLGDKYIEGTDNQYSFNGSTDSTIAIYNSGYFFASGPNKCFLFYKDSVTQKAVPVCNKPECIHEKEKDQSKLSNCNAFVGNTLLRFIFCNNKKIYFTAIDLSDKNPSLDTKLSLYQQNLDGTQRKKIYTFKENLYDMIIHRGYTYFTTTDFGTIPGKENITKTTMKFYTLKLNVSGEKAKQIKVFKASGETIAQIKAYGNNVYFLEGRYIKNSTKMSNDNTYRYDILSGSLKLILKNNYANYTFFNNGLIFQNVNGTFSCNLNGKNIKKFSSDTPTFLSSNGTYLFSDNFSDIILNKGKYRYITVYDKDGKSYQKNTIDKSVMWLPMGCSKDGFFCYKINTTVPNAVDIVYVPTENLLSGTAKPKAFFTNEP